MPLPRRLFVLMALICCTSPAAAESNPDRLTPIQYNNPGLVVDLGVGLWAWPLPMDYDRDGDMDLVVSCPDKPYNGVYFFENPGPGSRDSSQETRGGESSVQSPVSSAKDTQHSTLNTQLPVFKPAVRLGPAVKNIQISHADGKERLFAPGYEYLNFREKCWDEKVKLSLPAEIDKQWKRYRANQWKAVDWEGDGDQDLVIGIEVWDDYGWDDAWDENGNWKNGPLHGFVYLARNDGTDAQPKYAEPVKIEAGGKPIDVFGMPSPCVADFNGDGALDLICGEFRGIL